MFAKKFLTLLFMLAFTFSTGSAQHGGRGSGGSHKPAAPSHHPVRPAHQKPNPNRSKDGRRFDRNTHHHIDHHHTRVRNERVEFFFGGYWFGCNSGFPYWVFREDVWIEQVGPNVYMLYVYNNPAMQIQIFIVE